MNEPLSNKVENIDTKCEIAHNEQFLLLPQFFQKSSATEGFKLHLYVGKD